MKKIVVICLTLYTCHNAWAQARKGEYQGGAREYAEKVNPLLELIKLFSSVSSRVGVLNEGQSVLVDGISDRLQTLNEDRAAAEAFAEKLMNEGFGIREIEVPSETAVSCDQPKLWCNVIGVPYEMRQSNRPQTFSVECARTWSKNGTSYGSVILGDCLRVNNEYIFRPRKQMPFRVTSNTYFPITSTRGIATYNGEGYFDYCVPCRK